MARAREQRFRGLTGNELALHQVLVRQPWQMLFAGRVQLERRKNVRHWVEHAAGIRVVAYLGCRME